MTFFDTLVNSNIIGQASASLHVSDDEISLIRRHECLFYVFKEDWIYGIVKPHDRDLGLPAIHRLIRDEREPHKASNAEEMLVAIAKHGNRPAFLDVGTNYGQWVISSRRALEQAGASIDTVCFEPGKAAGLASLNLVLNGLGDVLLLLACVGDLNSVVPLYVNRGHTEDNKIINQRECDRLVPTPSVTLASVIESKGIDRDYFIKVDTQGAEWEVLKGFRSGRQNYAENVIMAMEFSPKALSSRVKPRVYLESLAEDFTIIHLDNKQNVTSVVNPDGFDGFISRIWDAKLPWCDILVIPKTGRLRTLAQSFMSFSI